MKNMLRTLQKGVFIVELITFIAFLTTHAYLGSFSRLMADDYCSAVEATSRGLVGGTIYWYTNWSGRYSADVIDTIMGLLGPRFIPFVTSLVLVTWLIGLSGAIYLLAAATQDRIHFLKALLPATIILSVTLIITPDLAQSLYWGQGMRSVVPPLIWATAITAYAAYDYDHVPKNRYGRFVIAGFLTFIAGGFGETYVTLQTSSLAAAVVISAIMIPPSARKKILPLALASLVGSLLSMAAIILAPGNIYRQAEFPPHPDLINLIRISIESSISYLQYMTSFPENVMSLLGITGVFVLFGSGIFFGKPGTISRQFMTQILLGFPLLTLLLILACFAPAAYAISAAPPGRTDIVPTYMLVCGLALWGYFLGGFAQTSRWFSKNNIRILSRAMIGIVLILFTFNTMWLTYRAMQRQPEYSSFATIWDKVDKSIRQAKQKGCTSIVVRPNQNYFGLSYFLDNPNFWVNECASRYYGLTVVTGPSWREDVSCP